VAATRQVDPDHAMVAGECRHHRRQDPPEAPDPWMSSSGGASGAPSWTTGIPCERSASYVFVPCAFMPCVSMR